MLNQSTNFGMRSWLVIEKLPLIFFRFPFQKVTWTGSDEGRQGGSQMKRKRKMISFYFFNFFVNRLYSFLPSSLLNARLHFHVIHPHLIIQHKVSFSSHFISFFLFYMDRVRQRQAGWQSDEEEEEDD